MSGLRVDRLASPADPSVTDEEWDGLLTDGDPPSLTRHWLTSWWHAFGPKESAVLAVRDAGRLVAVAPWYVDGGMLFAVGVEASDALDVVGRRDPVVLDALLTAVSREWPDLLGVRLHFLPSTSPTVAALRSGAGGRGLVVCIEDETVSPLVQLSPTASVVAGDGLARKERLLRRAGDVGVEHHRSPDAIRTALPELFDLHQRRWTGRPDAATFDDPRRRAFLHALAADASPEGGARLTTVRLDGRVVAAHFGVRNRSRYLWYVPCYDPEHARLRPGDVLLRSVARAALDEGARTLDLGIGDEPYKRRYATDFPTVLTLAAYAEAALVTS